MAFKDPCFGVAYGPSKYGKTTDLLYSVPNAYYIAAPGALKPAENVVGFVIPDENVYDAQSIPDATRKIAEVGAMVCLACNGRKITSTGAVCPTCAGTGKRFTACGVDDFSLLAERSASLLEKPDPGDPGDPKAKPPRPPRKPRVALSGFTFWGALRDEILDFRDAARRAGMHVLLNCHEVGPKIVNGMSQRGGPKLPGKLPEELPAACDLVLRATIQSGNAAALAGQGDKMGWKGVYRCSPSDTGFISGDRHGVTPDFAPMNLGEILRAAGYALGRAPGLEWMERAVGAIAGTLVNGGGANDAANLKAAAAWLIGEMQTQPVYTSPEALAKNLLGLHVRWVIRDAYDRVLIHRTRMNPLSIFGF